jgi:hypothetical protein
MGINDIALERILKFLVEENAMVKLIKVMENEKTRSSEPVPLIVHLHTAFPDPSVVRSGHLCKNSEA